MWKQTLIFLKNRNSQLQAALLAIFISSIAWLVASMALSLTPFGNETLCTNDGSQQYVPFLCEFWSIFREGGSLLYSFHGGLGNNFYLTCVYYLISPFTFLVLFFDKSQIPMVANLIIILKNILVIGIMAWYLDSKSEKPKPILASIIAIAYGFSYYFLSYSFNFMWMDGIALVPLMLYGIERLDTRTGKMFYTISLSLAILTNFYMGAIICIFLALYYLIIYLRFNKEGWYKFLIFSICSICAALIAGVVLIPVLKGLLADNASRMVSPEFEIYNDAKYFFSRLLPTAQIVKVSRYNRGIINLYMGVAPIFGLLLFLFTKQKSKREKYGLLILIILYLISTQNSFLNYVFHGFYMQRGVPNRYGFIINFLIAIGAYYGFSSLGQDSKKKIIIAGFITAWYFGVISAWNSSDSLRLTLILSGIAVLYMIIALYKKTYFISLLILMESIYGLTMLSPIPLNTSFTQMETYMKAIESINSDGRIEFIEKNPFSNPNTLYGTNGMTTFNSVMNSNVANFLKSLGHFSGSPQYSFSNGWTPISALFFGVQDIIADNDPVPVPSPFTLVNRVDNLTIYKSPYEVSLGVIPISDEELNNQNIFENINILYPNSFSLLDINASILGATETDKSQIHNKKYQIKNIKENDTINIKLNSFEGENIYIYSHLNGSKSFKVFKNNQELSYRNSNGFVVYVGSVKKSDEITIRYKASVNASSRIITLQAATLSSNKVSEAGEYFSSHCLQNQKIEGNSISGFYESSSSENMVFTLPYDEGWTAYVNGEKVPISSWQKAFLSISIQPGKNEIKLTFFPLGLKEGIAVSLIGLIMAWFLFRKKKGIEFKRLGRKEYVKN